MKRIPRHIIFDLDGTLIDSKQEIVKTYKLVFSKIVPGKSVNYEKINYGATINEVLNNIYLKDEEKRNKAKKLFSSIYDNSDFAETKIFEDVMNVLGFLKKQKNRLYIATNKRLVPTIQILKKKELFHLFSDIMANEMIPDVTLSKEQMIAALKSKYSFSEGFMVGDSAVDISAGNNQKLLTIAVSYGYEDRELVSIQNPLYVIDSFKEIISIVK